MRLRYHIFIFSLLVATSLFAQKSVREDIIYNDTNEVRQEFIYEIKDFSLTKTTLNNQLFYNIDMGEDSFNGTTWGQANLPSFNKIITCSSDKSLHLKMTILEEDTLYIKDDILIAPSQKSRLKIDTSFSFCFDKQYYSTNEYQNNNFVSIHNIGIQRDKNISVLKICPFSYNPVQNALRRIKKMKVEIFSSPSVNNISAKVNYSNLNHPYKMIILTSDSLLSNLNSFLQWKTMQGFEILTLTPSQIGQTSKQIKSYLDSLYLSSTVLNPPFDYLLIIGDTNIIPTFKGKYVIDSYPKHATDLYYAEYTNDILPDVFYGRISVSDTQTLNNVIEKTIAYEKGDLESETYLQNSLLVAGKELSHGALTFTNAQLNYAKEYLKAKTDTNVYYNPESVEDSNKLSINNQLNVGNCWINYTGHGTSSGWYNPPFRVKDVDTLLNNTNRYGIFINNCCLSGKYDEKVCFTESLLQAKQKGGVGAIGSSDYTLWDEDYYWSVGSKNAVLTPKYNKNKLGIYDRFFHTHNESLDQQYLTLGQVLQAGGLAVTQSLSDYTNHYWEMYNLQGDPTLIPYVGQPLQFANNLEDTLYLGTSSWQINTIPYSYIALSSNDTLIDARRADSLGVALFDLSDITDERKVKIVITNQFYKPLIDSVQMIAPNKPLIALKNIKVIDKNTNLEAINLIEGDQYRVEFDIANIGKQNLSTTSNTIKLVSEEDLVVSEEDFFFSQENSLTSQHIDTAFEFKVKNGVKNLDITTLTFQIYQGSQLSTTHKISKEIFAPDVCISSSSMTNLNDTILLDICLRNMGKKKSLDGSLQIHDLSSEIEVVNPTKSVKELEISEQDTLRFVLLKHTSNLESISFAVTYLSSYYEREKAYNISLLETKETFENGFSAFAWQNDSEYPWVIDTTIYNNGKKSVRSSKSLVDSKKSRLSLTLNNDISATISFFAKVSSEDKYDYFRFYIDNELKASLTYGYDFAGNESPWQEYTFMVPDGTHTLCFSYEKDQSTSYGEDCAWIDDFVLRLGSDSLIFGLEDLLEDQIIMYPNPAKNYISLENLPLRCDVNIIDNKGRVVYYHQNMETNNKIDIQSFVSGVYFVVVSKDGKRVSTYKLIVKK